MRWEKFFRCEDLGKDLPPVIKARCALGCWVDAEAYKDWEAKGAAPKEFKEEDRPALFV